MPHELYPTVTKELAQARTALAPETAAAFHVFSQQVFAEGALGAKTKQIIAVAVATSRNVLTASRGTPRRRSARVRPTRN